MTVIHPFHKSSEKLSRGRFRSSSKGLNHWKAQRLTGLFLVPLSLWFMMSLSRWQSQDWAAVLKQVASPFMVGAFLLLTTLGFYHAYLGMKVIIEDYVVHRGKRFFCLVLLQGCILGGVVSAWVSLIMILLKGSHQ